MVRPEHVHSAREACICYIHVYTYAIVYTCEKYCKYSAIINSDWHIIEISHRFWAYALSLLWTQLQYLVYLVDFVVNSMPCLQLQVVTLHVLCGCAKPRPSLNLILASQCRTPKPVDDTTDDLLSLEGCSETGVTVATLLLYFDDFLCHAVKPHWLKPTRNFFFFAWVKKWSGQNQAAQTASASPVTCCFAASAAQNRVMPLILWASNTTTRFRSKTSNFCNFTPEYTRNDLRSFSGGGGHAPRPT